MSTEAEAAFGYLSGSIICECGRAHSTTHPSGQAMRYIYCGCGVSYQLFKHVGWKLMKRKLTAWKAREKQLLVRIAELEEKLEGWVR